VTESEIIRGCKRGDRASQRELYVQTSERIFRLLVKMTRNQDTAIDLAQETYLRAFDRISQFNGDSSIATWLYRIAVNEALQFQRRKGMLPLPPDHDSSAASAASEGDRTAMRMDVNSALQEMEATDRAILILRYQEGLDYRQIAEILDCPAGTVASRLNRARDRLRHALSGSYGTEEEMTRTEHLRDVG